MTQSKKRTRKVFKPLAIAALMTGAMLQPFMLSAFAAPAGEDISNTATATYTDDDPTNVFTTKSNTVTVTIKEVAGITVTPSGVDDLNDGSFEANDELDFKFTVTNVGNDTTDIQLPDVDAIRTQNFNVARVTVLNSSGNALGNYTTGASLLSTLAPGAPKALVAGDFLTVVVNGTVPAGGLNPGADISVTLGDTIPNDNSLATQNQIYSASATDGRDLRTADVPVVDQGSVVGEAPGLVTPEKEASATQSVDFATQQRPLALAKVKKTDVNPVDPGATGAANDDIITYNLSLTVEGSSPNGAFIPEALEKTLVNVDGGNIQAILVSDVIPEFTDLDLTTPPAAPTDWEVVYSTSPVSTSPVVANGATPATWTRVTTTPIPNAAAVTRIGYIWTGDKIDEGSEISGFTYSVITNGLPAVGGNISNLAQVFGTTFDDPDPTLENPIAQIIYDESGDNNPNNFNDNGTPPSETDGGDPDGSDFDPGSDTGIADPSNHGTDDGSNTGLGEDGEDNIVTITGEELSGDDNILNGPDGSPSAVGPNDDDDDYTNKGVEPIDSGVTNVVFTNTVANPTTNTSEIDNVTLQPISAQVSANNDDDTATNPDKYQETPIPDGTRVTIFYDPTPATPGTDAQTAVYTYTGGAFELAVGSTPVNIGTLEPGDEVDYTVTVDFPADIAEGDIIEIPIIAFPDTGGNGFSGESINNITIDRIYAGFMTLQKEARLLDADGVTVKATWGTALTDAESGDIIEYRITYQNISGTAVGSGNIGLDAQNFEVVEDGDDTTVSPVNNWHNNTVADSLTLHAKGVSVTAGTVEFFTEYGTTNTSIGNADPSTGSAVEAYVNTVGTVVPGGSGTMTFRRQVQ